MFGMTKFSQPQQHVALIRRVGLAVIFGHDAGANQLVIPMNANNALAFIPLN
jgi:hypothetical protein